MTPGAREEIEKLAEELFKNPIEYYLNPKHSYGERFSVSVIITNMISKAILTQVEKARAESKYMPSELELFTILKKTYYENSELTGDHLWLKLSKEIRNKLEKE